MTEIATALFIKAGRLALTRSAAQEAAAHFTRGLELTEMLATGSSRSSFELDLQLGLASALIALEGYQAARTEQAYLRARNLLDETESDTRQFATLYGLFAVRWNRARLPEAAEVAADLLERAIAVGDAASMCVAHRSLAAAYNGMGRFQDALDHASKAVGLYDPTAHRGSAIQYGHDIGVAALTHLGFAQWFLGDAAGFECASARSKALAHEIGHANTIGYAEMAATFVRLSARDSAKAKTSASRLVKFSVAHGLHLWGALGQCMMGGALIDLGRIAEGLAGVETGLAALERAGERMWQSAFLCLRAKGLSRTARHREAFDVANLALQASETSQERWWEPEILRVRAETSLAASGRDAQKHAASDLLAAIECANKQGSRFLHLRAVTTLAALWRDQGRFAEAEHLLSDSYGLFADGVDAPDLKTPKRCWRS